MRINIASLQSGVSANIAAVARQGTRCTQQVSTIVQTSVRCMFLRGMAYTRLFDYLTRVKIPVVMQHAVYLSVLSQDMRADLRRLAELRMICGAVVDTDELQRQIEALQRQNAKLQSWADAYGSVAFGVPSWIIGKIVANNDNAIASLQRKLELAFAYANDSSIYARSSAEARNLNAAMVALGAVVYNPVNGTYNLSRVRDWSWKNGLIGRYYKSRTDLKRLVTYGISAGGTAFGGDPVNLATGNYVFQKEYLVCNGPRPLSLRPFYNSADAFDRLASAADDEGSISVEADTLDVGSEQDTMEAVGAVGAFNQDAQSTALGSAIMGPGWTHNFNQSLTYEGGLVVVRLADGSALAFASENADESDEPFGGSSSERFSCLTLSGHMVEKQSDEYVYIDKDGNRLVFDLAGRPVREEDARGNSVLYEYNPNGFLASVVGEGGAAIAFEYETVEGALCLTGAHDAGGRTIAFKYADGYLAGIVDEAGCAYGFLYDKSGLLSHVENPGGFESLRNSYDGQGRIVRQELADGGALSYEYTDERRVIATDQVGNVSHYQHDEGFRTTAITGAAGFDRFGYDEHGNRISHIDANGNMTAYEHDEQGRLSCVVDALGRRTRIERDDRGCVTRVVSGDALLFSNGYDDAGNLATQSDALGNTVAFEHDSRGDLVGLVRPDGSTVRAWRDERGNVVSVSEDGVVQARYEYDEYGRMIVFEDADGNRTEFERDARGNVVALVNPLKNRQVYAFDENGHIVSVIDFDGCETRREYDVMGNVVKAVGKDGSARLFEYDACQNMTACVDELGARTEYAYDARGRCVTKRDALGNTTSYEYDAVGNKVGIIDALGGEQRIEYDALNRPVSHRDALGAMTRVEYDEWGNPSRIIDALGGERTYEYDAAGRGVAFTDVLGNRTQFERDSLGNIVREFDPSGRERRYNYLPGGRLQQAWDYDGSWERFEYDRRGNVAKRMRADGFSVSFEYDALNRTVAMVASTGQKKRFEYDAVGNVVATIEANGAVTRYSYTPTGKLATVVDALGTRVEYEHDARGDLVGIRVIPAGGDADSADSVVNAPIGIRYERDAMGRVVCATDELGGVERYGYDALGRMVALVDRDGLTTRYSYTPTGLLEQVTYDDGCELKLGYDALQRVVQMEDWLGETCVWRDAAGRIVKVRDHEGREVSYELGKTGRRLGMVYPDGTRVGYTYDEALRLSEINGVRSGDVDGNDALSVCYAYDDMGRLVQKAFSNGSGSRYAYDERGLMASLESYDALGTIEQCRFVYDAVGNRSRIERMRRDDATLSGVYEYAYDELGRLVAMFKDGDAVRRYGYDGMGNRNYLWDDGVETRSAFNAANQLVASEGPDGLMEYAYDGRGNLVEERRDGEVVHAYRFDAANRLAGVFDARGQVAAFSSNGLGYRVETRRYDGVSRDGFAKGPWMQRSFGFAGIEPTETVAHVLDLTRRHHNEIQDVIGGDARSYLMDTQVVGELAGGAAFSFLNDELGSPVHCIGPSGKVLQSYAYDEFGSDVFSAAVNGEGAERNAGLVTDGPFDALSVLQPFGFAGYRRNPVGRLLHSQAREYHPRAGRFIERDSDRFRRPALAISFNQYIYCFDNPVVFIDPDGHDCYVFYLPEWENEALRDQQTLSSFYGINLSEVHLVPIRNNADLTNGWNSMGTVDGTSVDIQAVVINTHANPYQLGFGENSDDSFSAVNIQNLQHKDVGELLLYGCNSGHMDHAGTNVASEFASLLINGAPVVASDGTVYSGANVLGTPQTYTPKGDEEFTSWCIRDRDAEGWHVYRYENGRLVVSESLGFTHTVAELLNFCPA